MYFIEIWIGIIHVSEKRMTERALSTQLIHTNETAYIVWFISISINLFLYFFPHNWYFPQSGCLCLPLDHWYLKRKCQVNFQQEHYTYHFCFDLMKRLPWSRILYVIIFPVNRFHIGFVCKFLISYCNCWFSVRLYQTKYYVFQPNGNAFEWM